MTSPARPRSLRLAAATTIAAASADPPAWLLGLLAFLARGGVVLAVLPILSIPSPVLLSMLFRGEVADIGRGEARAVAIGVGLVLSLIAIAGVLLSSYAEVALADRLLHDPETLELRGGAPPLPLDAPARRTLVWWVASVQAIALLPMIAAVAFLVEGTVRAVTAEVLDPSSTSLPLVARIAPAIAGRVGLVVGVLLIVEALASLASRRLMVSAWGLLPRPDGGRGSDDTSDARSAVRGLLRVVAQPLRVVATAAAGWLAIGLTFLVVALSGYLAWSAARDVLVEGSGGDLGAAVLGWLLVMLFTGVWLGGLALLGFATAVRSGLWTTDAVR